jgi:hypothetical protein
VTESLGVGGTESHLIRLLAPLASRGWDTTVYCITERGQRADQLEAAGVSVLSTPWPAYRPSRQLASTPGNTFASRSISSSVVKKW